ncbi:MarR family winged helix-turn-helix transcriptional regulator [Loigolactobacillus jiayinensis]|uniref:MarR family winged helix-turn-helix transcriptional regulator n=1 Tax=Loigolactobacillus jiayinensis TaxID=2486016 RepID=A0ABW1RCQ2_9LACO|nr:MarR family transcriptional regulator [Loigolactobacillus jiayinensis]
MANKKNLTAVFELMTMLSQLVFDPQMIQKTKLSKNELLILALIKDATQSSMSELAKAIGTSPAQVTRSVTSLENKKLVQRTINPQNRRIIIVTLTHQGNALFSQHEQAVQTKLQQQLINVPAADYERLNLAIEQAVAILKPTLQQNK